jgi:hypothetical protein
MKIIARLLSETSLLFAVLLVSIQISSSALAADGYDLQLSPAPNTSVLGKDAYDFSGTSHPAIAITPTNSNGAPYSSYSLTIFNNGSEYTKKSGDASTIFNNAYNWDLCAGNRDNTFGEISVVLKGAPSIAPNDFSEIARQTFMVLNYKSKCGATENEAVPTASDLSLSLISGDGLANVKVGLDKSKLSAFLPTVSSKFKFFLQVDGSDKGLFDNDLTKIWNASGSTDGAHRLTVQYQNSETSTVVNGDSLTLYKNKDATVTTTSKDGVTDDGTGNGNNNNTGNGNLEPIKFDLPDFSRLKGLTGLDLMNGVFDLVISLIIIIVSMFAGVAYIFSGINYALSFGDQAKAEKAKKNLIWAVTGTVVALSALIILNVVSRVVNLIK